MKKQHTKNNSHKPSLAGFSNKTCQEQETSGGKKDDNRKKL